MLTVRDSINAWDKHGKTRKLHFPCFITGFLRHFHILPTLSEPRVNGVCPLFAESQWARSKDSLLSAALQRETKRARLQEQIHQGTAPPPPPLPRRYVRASEVQSDDVLDDHPFSDPELEPESSEDASWSEEEEEVPASTTAPPPPTPVSTADQRITELGVQLTDLRGDLTALRGTVTQLQADYAASRGDTTDLIRVLEDMRFLQFQSLITQHGEAAAFEIQRLADERRAIYYEGMRQARAAGLPTGLTGETSSISQPLRPPVPPTTAPAATSTAPPPDSSAPTAAAPP